MKAIVIGAGLAGLLCARKLHLAGLEITVLEASDGVGGRVRSDTRDGFILDRGFQVFFTAYPAALRNLDYAALDLCAFDPGAVIAQGDRRHILGDPIRDPASFAETIRTGIVTLEDKLRTGLLQIELALHSDAELLAGSDETTLAFLKRRQFSAKYIDNFIRPFFGSIFLDDSLSTTARAFRFYWKMLTVGQTVVPANGMGTIAVQLANELIAENRIHLRTRVLKLLRTQDAEIEVVLENGETIDADIVVIATDAPSASKLLTASQMANTIGDLAVDGVGCTNFYFAGDMPVHMGKKIILNANHAPYIRNIAQMEQIAPHYAPPGNSLLSATVLGVIDNNSDEETLFRRAMHDLNRIFAGDRAALNALKTYRPLRLYRIPYGQFAQPPGTYDLLPDNDLGDCIYLAGEYLRQSSIHGALKSGELTAKKVLRKMRG